MWKSTSRSERKKRDRERERELNFPPSSPPRPIYISAAHILFIYHVFARISTLSPKKKTYRLRAIYPYRYIRFGALLPSRIRRQTGRDDASRGKRNRPRVAQTPTFALSAKKPTAHWLPDSRLTAYYKPTRSTEAPRRTETHENARAAVVAATAARRRVSTVKREKKIREKARTGANTNFSQKYFARL